jgi:hypothetical protein
MTVTEASRTSDAPIQRSASRRYPSYLIFTLCSSLYLLPFMRILVGGDEGSIIYGAVRIVHGQVFARDFFEAMGPGSFYWQAIFFKLFGVTCLATRISLFFTSLGTGLLMYFLARKVCRKYHTLPCVLLASTCFGLPSISHHADSNFFALLSVACIVLWQDRRKDSLLIAAGVFAGATTCFLQPKGMFLLASLLLWALIQRQRRSTSLCVLSLIAGGYCSVITIVLVYFWSQGALWDLAYVNFVFPFRHYGAINALPYAYGIHSYWHWVIASSGFNGWVAVEAIVIVPFLFIAALPGLILILGALHRWNSARPQVLLYCLCGWALWLSEIHRKDVVHLAFGSPLLIILCVYFPAEYRGKIADFALQTLSIDACCLAAFNLILVLLAHPMTTRVGSVAVFKSDPVLTFVDEHVAPGEKMFVYPYCPTLYFLSATTNPTAYSFLMYDYNTPSQFEEVIRALEQDKVRYVLWDTNFVTKTALYSFPSARRPTPAELIIEPYLESHYNVVKAEDGVRIMERKSEEHAE